MSKIGFHICSFTDFKDIRIEAVGRSYRFEFSHRFGPAMLGKRGDTVGTMPALRSPFWKALQLWCQQGHVVDDGVCVYTVPASERGLRITPRHILALKATDDPAAVRAGLFAEMGLPEPPEPPDVVTFDEWACLRQRKAAKRTAA
jgi:hypothetical protein